jgi:hypothetical protein
MRGRNRSKGPNPLTRSYESNGPDVKIRGTAQHIAEKYSQLARDAQASGDPVAAENYLQHAEHYLRIIAAAQEQFRQQFGGYDRSYNDEGDDEPAGFGFPQQGDRPPAVQASGDALRDDRDRVSSAGLAVCGSSLIAAELVRVDVLECGIRGR